MREEVGVQMKINTGGYVPRPSAPAFGAAEGTGAPGTGARIRDLRSPLAEPDSSPEALTV